MTSRRQEGASRSMAARLVAVCALLSINVQSSDCSSAPSGRHETGALGGEQFRAASNSIMAIEDAPSANNTERGFMVSTTDHNYAIYSPCLLARGWLTVTVNGDQVLIVSAQKTLISRKLFELDEQQRDFIAEVRSRFTQNLAGLKFARGPSSSRRQRHYSSLCASNQTNVNFNYYNLLAKPLNATLTGDVYHFDLDCNILDVYTSSVSISRQHNLSALYRNADFFSYARSGLPLAINRLFLSHNQAFFVYHDGSVLVKLDWMLDQTELDVVLEARRRLKLADQWQAQAAGLLAKAAAVAVQ